MHTKNYTPHRKKGNTGEEAVAAYLEKDGFTICERNFAKPYGEIDIIARKGDTIAFIEVKTRRNPLFDMTELISSTKQKKIIQTALAYGMEKQINRMVYRFDVALVEQKDSHAYEISIIQNAFGQGRESW